MSDDVVIIWEAPKIIPPEFRLYYDEKGNVICYSCQQLEGNYIVIDALTYAIARPDVRIIDGKISTVAPDAVVYKLMPSDEGKACAKEDISIISDGSIETTKWKLRIYEL
jgi:hypothetical protein